MKMRRFLFVVAALVAIPLHAQVFGLQAPVVSQIIVNATGEARVVPDRATIQLSVQTRAGTAAQAGTENARIQRVVIDTLRGLGLATDQISTTDYNVSPDQQFNPTTRQSKIVGYTVTNTIRVDLRKIEQVGSAIDAALSKGANMVSSLQFFSSTADEVRRTALASAVDRARKDAETLAKAAGGSLGELLELSSGEVAGPSPRFEMAMQSMKQMDAPTPVNPGMQTIVSTVSARWRYVPSPR